MPALDVPVLIVGAGPAGLMSSLLLERMGVETLVVERRAGPQPAPAAHVVNARTLEICRAAGVDMQAVAAAAMDPADASHVYWVDKLGGRVLGRLPFEQQGEDQLAFTPTPLRNLSQNRFEPLLIDALRKLGRAPGWGREWESAEQTKDGVRSRVRSRETGEVVDVRSRYLLAADGAGSRIRKSLEIPVHGPDRIQSFVMVHMRADLRDRVGDPPGVLHFVCDPGSGGGVFVIHDLDCEAAYMIPFDPDSESLASWDAERCAAMIRGALADPSLDLEVEAVSSWAMTAQVAERYRDERIFLVGDSAHRFPPTGGLGLNTGVQDAHNLAWKLAAVLRKSAAAGLLDSYEIERKPVAQHNADQSLKNALRLIEVITALEITDESEASRARMERILADPEGRGRVEQAIARQAEHFDMPGLQLGFGYADGALVRDSEADEPTPPDPRRFVPNGAPGYRLPHAWVEGGAEIESLLDWVPCDRFLLLAGPEGGAWIDAAASLAEAPLVARALSPQRVPELDAWLAAAGIDESGALLVRPDQHVAWRASCSPADPEPVLAAVLQKLLHGPQYPQ